MRGLYIHIPFCASKCPYCDFYSMLTIKSDIDAYVESLIDEIKTGRRTGEFTKNIDFTFDTVYFGGGTPSVLGATRLKKILSAIYTYYSIAENAEITVECNPSSLEEGFFENIKNAGVNRISLGMQSASEKERKSLGRFANKEKIKKTIEEARNAGIYNISLDVMLGIPEQSIESLCETIDFCIDSGVPHISAYMLSIEEGTHFHKVYHKLSLPSEDTVCKMYALLSKRLQNAGFNHYEISNFAKDGYESHHNLKYWRCEEYLGLGPSAHSFICGKRFYFPRNIDSFNMGEGAAFDCAGGDFEEYIMLKLRLKEGIDLIEFENSFHMPFPLEKAKKHIDTGLLILNDSCLSLSLEGFLMSNTVISDIL